MSPISTPGTAPILFLMFVRIPALIKMLPALISARLLNPSVNSLESSSWLWKTSWRLDAMLWNCRRGERAGTGEEERKSWAAPSTSRLRACESQYTVRYSLTMLDAYQHVGSLAKCFLLQLAERAVITIAVIGATEEQSKL